MDAPIDIVDRARVVEIADCLCDAKNCGAKAYVFALMPNGYSIGFCGHHGTEYYDNLCKVAVHLIDLRATIGLP